MNITSRHFDLYFRRLYLPLGMYALRIVNDAEDARDIVSESFLKAWQTIEAGTEIENFKSYMYNSVRNECVSFLRRRRETVEIENIGDVDDEIVDTSERDAAIWRAIENLPERCREVFLLSKRDGLSQEEIAEELDISIKTVKNQMTKAYSRLRDELLPGRKVFFLPFL